jgi:GNAT superfamily N-acetyltransferase
MTIRPLQPADVAAAAELFSSVEPEFISTPDLLLHQLRSPLGRTHRKFWIAAEAGDVVGVAQGYLRSWSNDLDVGQIHLGVRADRRRHGIGTALLETVEQHLVRHGAERLRVRAERGSIGVEFARARGYARRVVSEVLWSLELPGADTKELPALQRAKSDEGFELSRLSEHRDSARALFDFYGAAGGLVPGAPVTFDDWRTAILGNPTLDFEGSVVVTHEQQPVALAWLLVDWKRAKAENEWTATLPELRGRGLARLAKLATIRWAAESGVREIRTENDADNAPMIALNRRLGYRELALRDDLEKRA